MSAMLELTNVSAGYGTFQALFDVSLSLVEWFTSPKMRPHTNDQKMGAAIEKQGAGDEAPIPPGRGQR